MIFYLRDKAHRMIFSLRLSLLSIFITLFVIVIGMLFSVFYFYLRQLTVNTAFLLLDKVSYSILHEMDVKLRPVALASQFSVNNIADGTLDVNNTNEMIFYMMRLLEKLHLAREVYWSDVNGNWMGVRKAPEGGFTMQVIDRRQVPASNTLIYLDKNHHEINRKTMPVTYDPRTRPWFKLALDKQQTIWTDVYPFEPAPYYLGITVATPLFTQQHKPLGVFGIDIGLEYLSQFMANQTTSKNSEIMLLDKHGMVVAAPQLVRNEHRPTEAKYLEYLRQFSAQPTIKTASEIYHATGQSAFQFDINGVQYVASFRPIPTLADNNWLIGIVAPALDFTRQVRIVGAVYLLCALAIFALGIVLMLDLVTRIVTPIKRLVQETEKIKNFDLSSVEAVPSRIAEVVELSESIDAMKVGLRSFKKYVPASLVRQLIKVGQDVKIGGAKRDIAIFFSDIKDFTAITERAESNELVQQMYDYFDAFSRIIAQEQGTIDKYIGDSVMAFWGAPLRVEQPCIHAARAAIQSLQRVQELNMQWLQAGHRMFITRLGIHFGEALVGNLGSSERLNYTAVGDAVNIANRLVSVNKIYGTSILVSEPVYNQIKDRYLLRLIDKVVFKGKENSVAIYELLGENKQQVAFELDAYQHAFMQGFFAYQQQHWQEALQHFITCKQVYPQDSVADIFIHRCQQFAIHPPETDWDGVWHFSEK